MIKIKKVFVALLAGFTAVFAGAQAYTASADATNEKANDHRSYDSQTIKKSNISSTLTSANQKAIDKANAYVASPAHRTLPTSNATLNVIKSMDTTNNVKEASQAATPARRRMVYTKVTADTFK